MIVTDFIARTYLLAAGKVATLTSDNAKYQKILALGNYFQEVWADEPGIDWASLRSMVNVGTVTATNAFALPSTVNKLSVQDEDPVRILTGTREDEYTIVPIGKLYDYAKLNHYDNSKCAVAGSNLVFAHSFLATDPQFGGTITVPAYLGVSTLANGTDVIQVDDPNWLVAMCAAEYVRTDVTRQQQYPNLLAMANESMQAMKERNGAQLDLVTTPWTPGVSNEEWA